MSAWRVQPWLPGALPRASAVDGAVGARRLLHNLCESDKQKESRTSVAHVCVVCVFGRVCVFPACFAPSRRKQRLLCSAVVAAPKHDADTAPRGRHGLSAPLVHLARAWKRQLKHEQTKKQCFFICSCVCSQSHPRIVATLEFPVLAAAFVVDGADGAAGASLGIPPHVGGSELEFASVVLESTRSLKFVQAGLVSAAPLSLDQVLSEWRRRFSFDSFGGKLDSSSDASPRLVGWRLWVQNAVAVAAADRCFPQDSSSMLI